MVFFASPPLTTFLSIACIFLVCSRKKYCVQLPLSSQVSYIFHPVLSSFPPSIPLLFRLSPKTPVCFISLRVFVADNCRFLNPKSTQSYFHARSIFVSVSVCVSNRPHNGYDPPAPFKHGHPEDQDVALVIHQLEDSLVPNGAGVEFLTSWWQSGGTCSMHSYIFIVFLFFFP